MRANMTELVPSAGIALCARGLSKRYRGGVRALDDCTFELPAGRVAALVGSNGAGKTTLLSLAAGLANPTDGSITINGADPRVGGTARPSSSRVTYVAQQKPLYPAFRVEEMLAFGRHMNTQWDQRRAERWLDSFSVPLAQRCGRLSGGQQAQVALAMALGSRPAVLLLDEPLSNLDPLVRVEVTRELLSASADCGTTIVLSTHVIAELNGVADFLLVLASGSLVLQGDADDLVTEHVLWVGPRSDPAKDREDAVYVSHTERQTFALIRRRDAPPSGAPDLVDPQWTTRSVSLDEIILAYLRAHVPPGPQTPDMPISQRPITEKVAGL